MAEPRSLLISLFLLLSCMRLSFCETSISTQNHRLPLSDQVTDIHDLLPKYGFPKGLIPSAAKSYSISSDGTFEIELDTTCYVQLVDLTFYDKKVKGKLSYGSITDISGIQVKKLFAWLPITGIDVNFRSDTLEFRAGFLSEKIPATMFEDIPDCRKGTGDGSLINSL